MSTTDRAQRLKIDTRLAVLDNITALNRQRKAAVQIGDAAAVERIQNSIDALHDQVDELSFLSLETLEDSVELKRTIAELRIAGDALDDEAETINDVATALEKGAKIVDQTVKIVAKLKDVVPV